MFGTDTPLPLLRLDARPSNPIQRPGGPFFIHSCEGGRKPWSLQGKKGALLAAKFDRLDLLFGLAPRREGESCAPATSAYKTVQSLAMR